MRSLSISLVVALIQAGCSDAPDPRTDDRPTQGDVVILADEDFRTLIEEERKVFEHYYRSAHLRIHYLPQAQLLQAMMHDSVRAVFTTCLPGADQHAYFRGRNLTPDVVPILIDGIAAIKAPSVMASSISVPQLKDRLQGTAGPDVLVGNMGTGTVRTLADSLFAGDGALLRGAAASQGVDDLVSRVVTDTTLVGLVSFALLSDLDDPRCRALHERVKLMGVAATDTGRAVLPNQSSLADGSYPLRRTLYAVLTEWKSGLGTGFVSFVANHKGQRIILKTGLAPHKVPAREVLIVNE